MLFQLINYFSALNSSLRISIAYLNSLITSVGLKFPSVEKDKNPWLEITQEYCECKSNSTGESFAK